MKTVNIRNITAADFDAIVKINDAEVLQTSPMDRIRLNDLLGISCYYKIAEVDGQVAAFLLAMQHETDYRNENYQWFAARFKRFLYIDRIVVDARFAGLGIGSSLYGDLFSYARSHEISCVACEYNIQPPNIASKSFHDRFGFRELDTQWVADRTKLVSLQMAEI